MNGFPQYSYTPSRSASGALLRAGGLEMHYQPILDLASNSIRKVEALARLRDAGGIVMPDDFLPELDDDDLYALFVLGLDTALRDRNQWLSHGHWLDISLNLPAGAMFDDRYVGATRSALARHGCPPSALTLEILESRDIAAGRCAAAQFRRFTDLGVLMAEDDLGSGYGSLTRLRELDFHWIKIDQGIVRLTGRDDIEVLQFVYQLTRLGHGLGKSVIVEGVEDASLIEAVRILGVDAAQGYGIAGAMPAATILKRMAGRTLAPAAAACGQALPRLARLLLAEERLHASLTSGEAGCDTWQLERFTADIGEIFPVNTRYAPCARALVETAMRYGLRSAAYRQARSRLTGVP